MKSSKKKFICELFEEQVKKSPDSIAVIYQDTSISYYELNYKAELLRNNLYSKGIDQGSIVGIFAFQSIEMIIGILGVLKAGCIYVPIATDLPQKRIQYIIKDSNIKLLLHTNIESNFLEACETYSVNDLLEDSILAQKKKDEFKGAYIIYTSGSTGLPKGILVKNDSLINLCEWHNKYYSITSRDNISKYAGVGFDASVWEIFPALIAGAKLIIINDEIRYDAGKLNRFFEKMDLTVSFLPTQMCEQFMEFDNQSLRLLLTGGDKLNKFHKKKYKLYNNYGPTESTVVATSFEVNNFEKNIPIGKPINNTGILVLDDSNNIQLQGEPGELHIYGDGLSAGYINNPELTHEKFKKHKEVGRLYATGDLVKKRDDGNIEFLGRIDNQVKIRGFRIEIGEIESVLLKHDLVNESAVITIDDNNEIELCAYIVYKDGVDEDSLIDRLRTFLQDQLPDYMTPSYFISLDKLPLTSNGKVDRKSLPKPEIKTGANYEKPSNEIERDLLEIWSKILNISQDKISINDNFFALGGHSLTLTRLISAIYEKFNYKLTFGKVFEFKTIKKISEYIEQKGVKRDNVVCIEAIEKKQYYDLSPPQRRMFYLQNTNIESVVYNISLASDLKESNDTKLEEAIKKIIKRHEGLRTSFHLINDRPVQRIWEEVNFSIEYIGHEDIYSEKGLKKIIKAYIKPFDLSKAPLFRLGVVNFKDKDVMLIDIHHIISDEWSVQLIAKEFEAFLRGDDLPGLKYQYKDYSEYFNSSNTSKHLIEKEKFWLEQYHNEVPELVLPMDYQRPNKQEYLGNNVLFRINGVKDVVDDLCEKYSCTGFIIIFTLFKVLLYKISGQSDIVVGTPFSGRTNENSNNILGLFVNTLPIRTKPESNKSFKEFLLEVKNIFIKTLENQEYPFENLVQKLGIRRVPGKNPIYNVIFNFLRDVGNYEDVKVQDTNEYEHIATNSMFDLSFIVYERPEYFTFSVIYSSKIFKSETIDRMINVFKEIITSIKNDYNIKLSNITISDSYQEMEKSVLQIENDNFDF